MIEDQGPPPQEAEEGDEELDEELDEEFADYIERVFDIRTIRNPYNEQSIMIIGTVGNRAIIGGILEMDNGLTPVYQPLMFSEVPVNVDDSGKINEVGPRFDKHFMLLQVIDWMLFRLDSIYICKATRSTDMAVVEEYERAVKRIRANDSNIEITDKMPPPPRHLGPVK